MYHTDNQPCYTSDDNRPYYVSDRAKVQQVINRRRTLTCDSGDDLSERVGDLEAKHGELEDRVNNQTSALGEVRAKQKKDRDRLDAHEKMLLGSDEAATDDVGGQNVYGPKGQVAGYSVTSDEIAAINYNNRQYYGLKQTGEASTPQPKLLDMGKTKFDDSRMKRHWQNQDKATTSLIRDINNRNAAARVRKAWSR